MMEPGNTHFTLFIYHDDFARLDARAFISHWLAPRHRWRHAFARFSITNRCRFRYLRLRMSWAFIYAALSPHAMRFDIAGAAISRISAPSPSSGRADAIRERAAQQGIIHMAAHIADFLFAIFRPSEPMQSPELPQAAPTCTRSPSEELLTHDFTPDIGPANISTHERFSHYLPTFDASLVDAGEIERDIAATFTLSGRRWACRYASY